MRKVMMGLALAAGVAASSAAVAQEPDAGLGPVPRPVSLFLLDKPTMTVSFQGDHGFVRVTGTLEKAPEEPLRIRSIQGVPREVRWTEIRGLSIVDYPREGMPSGTYQVSLVSDAVALSSVSTLATTRDYGSQGTWGGKTLPEGELTLSGAPFGTMTIPLSRVSSVQQEPLRGTFTEFPKGQLTMEILSGKSVSLPLEQVQTFQRDQSRGTATVTLADNQTFTGKIGDLPNVNIPLITPTGNVMVPISRVSYLERTPPGGRLF